MLSTVGGELEESLLQLSGAWRSICAGLPEFESHSSPGLEICWGGVPLMFLNMAFLNTPIADASDLKTRASAVLLFMQAKHFPGMLAICHEHIPADLRAQTDAILAEQNLFPLMPMTGMATSSLRPPVQAPVGLVIRRAATEADSITIMDLNSHAYGLPLELGRASLSKSLADPDWYCCIGEHEGQAVACAVTFPLDDRLYVAFVATLPEFRRRGYAEAVMRDSLARCAAATSLSRTVLHATDLGHPVYERMGYHDTARFTLYAQPLPEHAG